MIGNVTRVVDAICLFIIVVAFLLFPFEAFQKTQGAQGGSALFLKIVVLKTHEVQSPVL